MTGLRGAAAFAVCVTHAAFWAGDFTPDVWGAAYARLETAVPVFFALSGYLLIRPWLDGTPDPRRYFTHRAWRVLPAYWTVVTVVYLIYLWRPDESTSGHGWGGYLRNMLFVHVYGVGHVHTGLSQTWSMCVEVVFYLLLPVLGLALMRLSARGWLVPAGMLTLTVGWIVLVTATEVFGKTARTWPPSYAAALAAGITVAMTLPRVRWTPPRRWLLIVLAALGYAILLTPLAGPIDLSLPSPAQGVVKFVLEAVIAGLLVAWAASGPSRLLSSRPVVWLGEISYEYFLIHVLVMDVVVRDVFGWSLFHGSTWLIVAATTVLTVPLAWLLHTAVHALQGRAQRVRPAVARSPH